MNGRSSTGRPEVASSATPGAGVAADTVTIRLFYAAPLTVTVLLLPWPKKRTILEIRGEKNAVPRVISCSIRRVLRQKSPLTVTVLLEPSASGPHPLSIEQHVCSPTSLRTSISSTFNHRVSADCPFAVCCQLQLIKNNLGKLSLLFVGRDWDSIRLLTIGST